MSDSNRFVDVAFGDSELENLISDLKVGDNLSVAKLLAAAEGESEEVLLETLEHLADLDVSLDLSGLPVDMGGGELSVRLRREHQLAQKGFDMTALEETDPLRLYLEEMAAIPVCGDIRLLAQQLAERNRAELEDTDLWTRILNLNLNRIFHIACQHTGHGVLLLDLIQEGSMGLWSVLQCYYTEDCDMETFCDRHIRNAMARCITVQAFSAGVGQKMRQAVEDYRAVDERLLAELGRNATLEELGEAMHLSADQVKTVADMFTAAQTVQKAKAPVEQSPEDDQAVEDTAYFQMRQRIADLLADLDSREAEILSLRFGLEGGKPLSPEETGKKLNLTAEEVVALEAAALAKLRRA